MPDTTPQPDPAPPVTGSMRDPDGTDVTALYRRLVHHYRDTPDSASVLAQAVAAAMGQAIELADMARDALKRHQEDGTAADTHTYADATYYGQVYAANKIMRAVFDSITPGKAMSVGYRLAARRALCGLTQAEVAAVAYMDRSNIRRIERGDGNLRPLQAKAIAELLGCTMAWLLTGEGGRP